MHCPPLLFLFLPALASASPLASVRFAVTQLLLVDADSADAALALCGANPHAQAAGVDWSNANGGRVRQLCVTREPVDSLKTSAHVVQRIDVHSATACPHAQTELFRPQDDVVVCVTRAEASRELLASGNFLSDVWVSGERNYNADVPGWTTIPTSVLEPADGLMRRLWQWLWTPSYGGAFITYEKPIVPIRAVKIVGVKEEDTPTVACEEALGVAWEHTGDTVLMSETTKERSMLCVRRGDTATSDRVAMALTDVAVANGSTQCDETAFKQRLPLPGASMALCLQWSDLKTSQRDIVVNLRLEEATKKPLATLTGQYKLQSDISLSGRQDRRVYLYTQSSWASFEHYTDDDSVIKTRPPLHANANADGSLSFKILQIADLHYSGDPTNSCRDVPDGMKSSECNEALMTTFVNELLDLEKPDFVAFTGDNVQVYRQRLRQASIDVVTQGVEERGIPYAVIFGNHDDERGFSREMMMDMYVKKPHAYVTHGPKEVAGVGNYEINVKAPVGGAWGDREADVFRMYFLDSHAYPDDSKVPYHVSTYDWIKPSQVAYYRQLATQHARENSSVPAVMFFHIPLPEYAMDAKSLRSEGEHNEGVASSGVNSNLFATLAELGEVKATFCGHDHVNDYCYKREGVQLCYGGGIGLGTAYGRSSYARRARVVEWSMDSGNGKRRIRSWRRLLGDAQSKRNEEVLFEGES